MTFIRESLLYGFPCIQNINSTMSTYKPILIIDRRPMTLRTYKVEFPNNTNKLIVNKKCKICGTPRECLLTMQRHFCFA